MFATLAFLQAAPLQCTWENGCCARHRHDAVCRRGSRGRAAAAAAMIQSKAIANASGELRGFRSTSNFAMSLEARKGSKARNAYVLHQQSKLRKAEQSERLIEQIRAVDVGRQAQVTAQFEEAMRNNTADIGSSVAGQAVLCIGARLGGEVRALKALGALAIGIDLNPGPNSMDVVVGDMEDIPFPPNTFHLAYSNVLDHVYHVSGLAAEVCRVLRQGGLFVAAVMGGSAADAYSPKQAIFESNRGSLVSAMAAHGLPLVTTTLTWHTIWDTGKTSGGALVHQRHPAPAMPHVRCHPLRTSVNP